MKTPKSEQPDMMTDKPSPEPKCQQRVHDGAETMICGETRGHWIHSKILAPYVGSSEYHHAFAETSTPSGEPNARNKVTHIGAPAEETEQ